MNYRILNQHNYWTITEIIVAHICTDITGQKRSTYACIGALIPSTTNPHIVHNSGVHAFPGSTRLYVLVWQNRTESQHIVTSSWQSVLKFHVIHAAAFPCCKQQIKYNTTGQQSQNRAPFSVKMKIYTYAFNESHTLGPPDQFHLPGHKIDIRKHKNSSQSYGPSVHFHLSRHNLNGRQFKQ